MSEFIETYYDLELKKDSDFEVALMGFEDCAPGHRYGPILRPYHIVHFVTGGRGTLHIDNQEFSIDKGCIFFIPENTSAYYVASQSDPWQYSWCAFLGRRSTTFKYQFMAYAPEKYVLRDADTEKYAKIIRKAAVLEGRSVANYFYSKSVIYEVLAMFASRSSGRFKAPRVPDMAERIKFQLDSRYREKILLSQVADDLGIHPNYLSRVFRDRYGTSPKQYLLGLKLSRAANLLITTEMPISAISASLGFEDQMSFSKSFKKQYGCSPMSYRKSQVRSDD